MARGVGIFRPEGGTEGIYIFKSKGEGLSVQLTADGKICRLSEKVLGKIHTPVLFSGHLIQIQRGYLKHFPCSLTVTARNQRRVHIHKASLHKKAVDGICDQRTHPEHRLKGVGSGTQMRDGPQVFKAVPLFL